METMHYFKVQKSLSLKTKILCISWVPMYDLAPMKYCPVGCKVGQISSRGRVLMEENLAPSISDVNGFDCKYGMISE